MIHHITQDFQICLQQLQHHGNHLHEDRAQLLAAVARSPGGTTCVRYTT